jgi:hypothetical protein
MMHKSAKAAQCQQNEIQVNKSSSIPSQQKHFKLANATSMRHIPTQHQVNTVQVGEGGFQCQRNATQVSEGSSISSH